MNWKNYLKVEVSLPVAAQGRTLGYFPQDLTIYPRWIMISNCSPGCSPENLRWKTDFRFNGYHVLVSGKATPKSAYNFNLTNFELEATNTTDGINPGNEKYSVRIISFN